MSFLSNVAIAYLKQQVKSCALRLRGGKQRDFGAVADANTRQLLEHLQAHGWALLPHYMPADWCARAKAEFEEALQTHAAHVRRQSDERLFGVDRVSPALAEFASDAYLQELSDLYHGAPSKLGSCLAGRLMADGRDKLGSGGDWHRDSAQMQFKTIVYLEDVSPENGAFQMLDASNLSNFSQFKQDCRTLGTPLTERRFTDAKVQKLLSTAPDRLQSFEAPKGTVILADTSAIHRGKPIASGERFVVFNYYYPQTTSDAWIEQKMQPIPVDEAIK